MGSWLEVRPRLDQLVQLGPRALSGPYVTVPLEGVGGADVTQVKAALDEPFDHVESSVVGDTAVEVPDHTDT